jgi:hypothetical protein
MNTKSMLKFYLMFFPMILSGYHGKKKKTLNILVEDGMLVPFEFLCSLIH